MDEEHWSFSEVQTLKRRVTQGPCMFSGVPRFLFSRAKRAQAPAVFRCNRYSHREQRALAVAPVQHVCGMRPAAIHQRSRCLPIIACTPFRKIVHASKSAPTDAKGQPIRQYCIHLKTVKKVARQTATQFICAFKLFWEKTLKRQWPHELEPVRANGSPAVQSSCFITGLWAITFATSSAKPSRNRRPKRWPNCPPESGTRSGLSITRLSVRATKPSVTWLVTLWLVASGGQGQGQPRPRFARPVAHPDRARTRVLANRACFSRPVRARGTPYRRRARQRSCVSLLRSGHGADRLLWPHPKPKRACGAPASCRQAGGAALICK
jgi:hypothetical protein